MSNLLQTCVGVDDFNVFVKERKAYYVDKTKFIKAILSDINQVFLFTRPRRFGKTLMMSMLGTFLKVDYNALNNILSKYREGANLSFEDKFSDIVPCNKTQDVFKHLDIYKESDFCKQYMGQYPVLSFSFKDVFTENGGAKSLLNLALYISKVLSRLPNIENAPELDEEQKYRLKIYKSFSSNFSASTDNEVYLENCLCDLCEYYSCVFHRNVFLLIDEYDVPIAKSTHEIERLQSLLDSNNCANREQTAQELELYKTFKTTYIKLISSALKDTSTFVVKAIVTGCLRVAKESIFTGVNNFKSIPLDNTFFGDLFGFTEKDVDTMLNYYDKTYNTMSYKPLIKQWYDGYLFGDKEIYCPWDVINFIDNLTKYGDSKPSPYWGSSSANQLLQDLFNKNPNLYVDDFQKLVDGGNITVKRSDFLNYQQIEKSEDKDYFWNLLYSTGYLTKSKENQPVDVNQITLIIPNKCVKTCIEDRLKWCFTLDNPKFKSTVSPIIDALYKGQNINLMLELRKLLVRFVSFMDKSGKITQESYYHSFMNGVFSQIATEDNNVFDYASNKELGEGRADISFYIVPNDLEKDKVTGVVIELKSCLKSEEAQKVATSALEQIKTREYAKAMLDLNSDIANVRAYGIAFYGKSCKVVSKLIER